ncbi:MAG: 30S ribosomal protein S15 [Candidatus Marinimicrobia bacterium]|jgi:small subunit ribosomal protein S15|nr:30S ribosomal protein S15 [Candidatus Neomarinimicrobiota bacterium]MBS00572.1 30S ribosomal protein S15 [Candidatus Neomarinimicrobiota bacterium]MEC7935874.1 30S ribosomal protein S15 [Candidatus Neomarinimicrobiota bacterium]MEC9027369.1 30S ribosomal protein S15 [Candidatus Neomarinimicrobiota bacterium]MEC9106775.1 30S ribosomal protein S15 [Candidatus Neomarinimicrobiota bacterium]|tara:strand:- start:300 stop:569 length:270 start_codon:yes stop_codon:yes gene_type:complete
MPLNKDEKEKIVSKFGENNTDTGSSSVQIALLTSRIRQLTEHVTNNKKDNHSRRGLVMLVGQRKRLMKYLRRKDLEKYEKVVNELKIRG